MDLDKERSVHMFIMWKYKEDMFSHARGWNVRNDDSGTKEDDLTPDLRWQSNNLPLSVSHDFPSVSPPTLVWHQSIMPLFHFDRLVLTSKRWLCENNWLLNTEFPVTDSLWRKLLCLLCTPSFPLWLNSSLSGQGSPVTSSPEPQTNTVSHNIQIEGLLKGCKLAQQLKAFFWCLNVIKCMWGNKTPVVLESACQSKCERAVHNCKDHVHLFI